MKRTAPLMLALLSVYLSVPAFADPPADAPLDEPGRSMVLEAGSIVPFKAACLDEQEDRRRERARVKAETKVGEYEQDIILPKLAFAGIVVGVAVFVAAGTALAFKLNEKK